MLKRARPAMARSGCSVGLAVARMARSQPRMSAGRIVNTHTRLQMTPFASTMPRSAPILKLMKTSASRPTNVVSELEVIAENAPATARRMAASR